MTNMENTIINELIIQLAVFIISSVLAWVYNKVKQRKNSQIINSIWRCPYAKSVREKYDLFLAEMICVMLIVTFVGIFLYVVLLLIGGVQESMYKIIMQWSGILIFGLLLCTNNSKDSFEKVFEVGYGIWKREFFLLNIPIVSLMIMWGFMFSKHSMYITSGTGVLYVLCEIFGFYFLDNSIKYRYNKARIYIEGFSKYKDIDVESIREEKKWLVFTYHEFGNNYAARILKSTIERVEYYNEH